jgi:two-component system C4-dicarboxylate transport sensor histidine kinase DctB
LLIYGATGFILSVLTVLAVLFGVSSAVRRRQLTDAKVGALVQATATLEARVQTRTSALSAETEQHKETAQALQESQSQLIQAAKFKVLNDMANGLAHEISQPLFALSANLETLDLQLGAQADGARASLKKAQRVTGRIGRILSNLKNFARKEQAIAVSVELSGAVISALEILEHEVVRHQIELVHLPPTHPVFGMATQTRLQQVIVNIVSNSIDAVAKDGGGVIRIEYSENGAAPEVRISDNGPGFPDADAALTPFHTTKADQNGLGLGLSISADIMKGFAGALALAETSDGGACVVLQFEPAAAMAKL